jgi:hypothetical protein
VAGARGGELVAEGLVLDRVGGGCFFCFVRFLSLEEKRALVEIDRSG